MTVIWDWNGTLLNDVQLSCELLNKLLKNNGYKEHGDVEKYKQVFCFPIKTYYEKAGFDFEKHSFEDLAHQYMDMFRQEHLRCTLQPHAEKLLRTLKENNVRQVMLSASPVNMLQLQTEHWGVKQYFDEILGLSDIYAQSKAGIAKKWIEQEKPDIKGAVMIGDTLHDVEVANAMGVKCVLFSGGHQSMETLKRANVPIIDDLLQVLNYV